jgi:tRNA (guanine-N7-)-methyltransferase
LLPRLRVPRPEPDGGTVVPAALFPNPVDQVWLEVGFGGGEHLAAQAADHPAIGFIGCDPFLDGVAGLLALIEDAALANLRVFDEDARLLLPALPDASIGRVFVLFSDPWPKTRHHKRRFPDALALAHLARVLVPGGELRFATDDAGYAVWFLDRVLRHPAFEWMARRPGDWSSPPGDWRGTRYEAKALAKGKRCFYLRFQRRGGTAAT